MDSPTKLSENILLSGLVKMDDTLRSSAYYGVFLIKNMLIVNAYELVAGNDLSNVSFDQGKKGKNLV